MAEETTQSLSTKEIFSPQELADYLGIGRTFAYELIMGGEIPSFTLGRLRRVRRRDVDAFVARKLEAS